MSKHIETKPVTEQVSDHYSMFTLCPVVSNVQVYGLKNAVKVSKYPMAVYTCELDSGITKTTGKLFSADLGSGHDCALKGIVVQFDLTLTMKAWVQAERYHWLDFISSQSAMHRVTRFNIADQCCEYVWVETIQSLKESVAEYNALEDKSTEDAKELYLEILYNLPSGFKLTAGITTNYLQLKTVYHQRRHHRLPEWIHFCEWVESLPYFKELVLGE